MRKTRDLQRMYKEAFWDYEFKGMMYESRYRNLANCMWRVNGFTIDRKFYADAFFEEYGQLSKYQKRR